MAKKARLVKGIRSDLSGLASRMKEIADEVETGVVDYQRELASNLVFELAEATPVDVGTARSNWLLAIGAEPSATIPAHSPGEFLGRMETANLFGAQVAAERELMRLKADDNVVIVNNLPYIARLNDGYSKQSAAGFVQRAISRAQESMRGKKVLK